MTAPNNPAGAPGASQNPPEGNDTRQGDSGPQNGAEGDSGAPERESAIRKRAQDAESARDALAVKVEKMQRREVEVMADGLHDAADLWSRVQLSELLDDDGEVDSEKVALAVSALRDCKPYLFTDHKPAGRLSAAPGFGQGSGHQSAPEERASWGQVLAG